MRDFPGVLLQCSASMSLVTLVYAAILPLLSKRYDAAWRYMGWLVIAAGWIFPFRPVILLPPFNLAPDELSLVLKHELIHVQRHDLWCKALILAATALHWFNPAVYLMAQAAAVQCEVSCDALVLRGADLKRRRQYGETIMAIVRNGAKLRTALSTNFYGGKRGMKNRISSIMDTKRKRAGVVILCLALAGIVAAGAVFADTTDEGMEITTDSITDSTVSLSNNRTNQMSVDGGQTWMSVEEYQQRYPTPDVVWWTYDDYSEWLEQEKINLRLLALVHPGWSQERVDTAIQGYERILEGIGNGMRYSRSIDGYDELVLGLTIGPVSNSTGVSFGDSVIDLGSYATKEERLAAVAAFCDEQVKAGNMTRREADMILSEF